jgi:hypothetical protein
VLAHDCVATAPTLARAHGTTAPTAGNFDATATPQSPAAGSAATIENVIVCALPSASPRREEPGGLREEVEASSRPHHHGLEGLVR